MTKNSSNRARCFVMPNVNLFFSYFFVFIILSFLCAIFDCFFGYLLNDRLIILCIFCLFICYLNLLIYVSLFFFNFFFVYLLLPINVAKGLKKYPWKL